MERIDLFRAFFTEESDYYADKLEKYEQGTKYSFNFWAGFLGPVWFCFRKLYVEALVLFLLTFVLSSITAVVLWLIIPNEQIIVPFSTAFITIISFVILGYLGNTLYLKKSKKIVEDFISENDIENINNSLTSELREKGGTSMAAALVCAGIQIAIQILSKVIT